MTAHQWAVFVISCRVFGRKPSRCVTVSMLFVWHVKNVVRDSETSFFRFPFPCLCFRLRALRRVRNPTTTRTYVLPATEHLPPCPQSHRGAVTGGRVRKRGLSKAFAPGTYRWPYCVRVNSAGIAHAEPHQSFADCSHFTKVSTRTFLLLRQHDRRSFIITKYA